MEGWPWPSSTSMAGYGSSPGERGEWVIGGCGRGGGSRPMAAWFGPAVALCGVCVRKKTWRRKKEKREKKKREREKKKRKEKMENLLNQEILGEKNKR
jgi:hypothetical protein